MTGQQDAGTRPWRWSCPRCSRTTEDEPGAGRVLSRTCTGDPLTGQMHPPTAMTRPATPPPAVPAPPITPTPTPGGCRWCGGQRYPAGFLGRYLICPTCDLHPIPKENPR